MAGDVVIIINKVLEEKSEIRGKKTNILCAKHYLGKKTEPETWDNDSPYTSGVIREVLFWDEEKRLF